MSDILGNSQMTYYLNNPKDISLMEKCLFSYNLAQKHLKAEFADLLFNKASVHLYLQDYLQSISLFKSAHSLDATLEANLKFDEAQAILKRISKDYFENFLSQSARAQLRKKIAKYEKARGKVMQNGISKFKNKGVKPGKTWRKCVLSELKKGRNSQVFTFGKFVRAVDFKNSPAKMFLMFGPPNEFAILAIFNCSDTIFSQIRLKKSTVLVIDPRVKFIETGIPKVKGERDCSRLPCLQLFDANNLIIDNMVVN